MAYGMKRADRIIIGEKVTTRSNERNAESFIQGTEINKIGISRSGLPVLGRNRRYQLIDTSITGSITDENYFIDSPSSHDAGLGQDFDGFNFLGTLYNSSGIPSNGFTVKLPDGSSAQINLTGLIIDGIFNFDFQGLALGTSHSTYHKTLYQSRENFFNLSVADFKSLLIANNLPQLNLSTDEEKNEAWKIIALTLFAHVFEAEAEIHKTIVNGVETDTYFNIGTYKSVPTVNVKFPDGRIQQKINFRRETIDYGYGKEYIDSVPCFDLEKYDAVKYIETNAPTGMFPILGTFISYDEKLSYDGIIEPFAIRSRALGLNIFAEGERQPGQVTGDVNISAENSVDARENDYEAEFYEDVLGIGHANLSLTDLQALFQKTNFHNFAFERLQNVYVSDFNKNAYPFVERDNADLLINDHAIEVQLLGMDPTVDEGTLPEGHIDMAVGFTSHSRDRINSINYRSMLRR